ncbi:HvfB family MNIO-type RiPP peptide maturase [Porticoccus sp. GXU_MW_L64]
MTTKSYPVTGAGLGLRRCQLDNFQSLSSDDVQFMEVAPENWINVGGRFGRKFRQYTERFPFVCHGLSLSIGSPAPLDFDFLADVKAFMSDHGITTYTEHLTYCSDNGHLYDLLPIPFTEQAIHYVADRIRQVQDFLGQRIAMENASYYAAPQQEMSEIEFINAVLAEADCDLLLDVNNIYVNSINHRYDPDEFLAALPGERVSYVHIAGHYNEAEDLRVDTHGTDVIDPVWALLDRAYQLFGVMPTLLERDFNIPPLPELMTEIDHIKAIQQQHATQVMSA